MDSTLIVTAWAGVIVVGGTVVFAACGYVGYKLLTKVWCMLFVKNVVLYGANTVHIGRYYTIRNRKFIKFRGELVQLNDNGTVAGKSYLTHWEELK